MIKKRKDFQNQMLLSLLHFLTFASTMQGQQTNAQVYRLFSFSSFEVEAIFVMSMKMSSLFALISSS